MSRSNSVSPPGVAHPGLRGGTEHKSAWAESESVSNGCPCPYASRAPPGTAAAAAPTTTRAIPNNSRWRGGGGGGGGGEGGGGDDHEADAERHRPRQSTTTVSRVSFRSRSAWQDHGERQNQQSPKRELRGATSRSVELQERRGVANKLQPPPPPPPPPLSTGKSEPEPDAMPEVAVRVSLVACCARVLHVFKSKKFQSEKLERLYQRYFFRLNQSSLTMLMAVLVLLFTVMLGFHCAGGANVTYVAVFSVAIFLILVLMVVCNRNAFHQDHMWIVCYALILLVLVVQVIGVLLVQPRSASEGVWWTVFFIHVIYTLLPVRMRAAVITGLVLAVIHVVVSWMLNAADSFVWKQVRRAGITGI